MASIHRGPVKSDTVPDDALSNARHSGLDDATSRGLELFLWLASYTRSYVVSIYLGMLSARGRAVSMH